MNKPLKIIMWGKEVGILIWNKNNSYFTFNEDFIRSGLDIAPMIAPTGSPQRRLPIYGEEGKYQKLPPFLADSLPDDWGNQLFEQWRAANKLSQQHVTPLEKLSFIGRRGMGAFEFVPEVQNSGYKEKIDVSALVDLAQRMFTNRENVIIKPEDTLTMQLLIAVGTSAGGRQPKAILAINHDTGEIRSGQVADLEGYDYCILKFGDTNRSSAELEMTYYDMCRKAGISIMESRLMDVEGRKHFLTKRFDRDEHGRKLHTQTLAAICPQAESYEHLIQVCRKLRLPESDCEQIFRRLVFNVLANNTDDHNKNTSFIMNEQGRWSLAPAYDMTFIFNRGGYQPEEQRCMMVRGKTYDITKDDIIEFAREEGIRNPKRIMDEVASAVASFRDSAFKNGVKEEWINIVDSCISKNLWEWGYKEEEKPVKGYQSDGHLIENLHFEDSYKGNIHLCAKIDGKEQKHVFRKGTEVFNIIKEKRCETIAEDFLHELADRYLLHKEL